MRHALAALSYLFVLAACVGGGDGRPPLPDGVPVETPAFETYVTDHNGFSRVRLDQTTAEDAPVIAAFEDADPTDPAGYRNVIALNEAVYAGRMHVEVIAQVDGDTGPVQRLLRLTVDQSPFQNLEAGRLVAADGVFYLRGHNFSWVSIDDGPILSGNDPRGLVDLALDFGNETATIDLRTGVGDGSGVRTEIAAMQLPFNIRTGAYGGDVVISVWDPDSPDILSVDGSLRGTVGGRPAHANDLHDLSTSGLYTADGTDSETGRQLSVRGAYVGVDPNALPNLP